MDILWECHHVKIVRQDIFQKKDGKIVKDVNQAARRISLKPSSSKEQDQEAAKYMQGQSDAETYNPFALLLKKKK